MKHAIFSDVQGNYPALRSFFEQTNKSVDGYICLGDIVQHGTSFDDNRCIELIKNNNCVAVRGNHEDYVIGRNKPLGKIFPENMEFIASLPLRRSIDDYHLVHAPSGQRVVTVEQARKEFSKLPEDIKICFFGHSHKQTIFSRDKKGKVGEEELGRGIILLRPDTKYLINPGGVGLYYGLPQTYMILDEKSLQLEFINL